MSACDSLAVPLRCTGECSVHICESQVAVKVGAPPSQLSSSLGAKTPVGHKLSVSVETGDGAWWCVLAVECTEYTSTVPVVELHQHGTLEVVSGKSQNIITGR